MGKKHLLSSKNALSILHIEQVNSIIKKLVMKCYKNPQNLEDFLDKMDMRCGTWNVRSLYRAGLLIRIVKEVSKYKSNLV
jgi:hypothetical protein